MDFNQVRYFLALADTLNFTRAAERCYVSQPALTQAIKRLEDELSGELIHRNGRNTELTKLGKTLRGHFEQIDRTRHLVQRTAKAVVEGEIAELNIGVMCTIGPGLIVGLLDAFRMHHPMVSIVLHDVTPDGIPELLLSGALDAVFHARRGLPHSQLRNIRLFEEEMVIVFARGHVFSEMKRVSFTEIGKHCYVDRIHCEFREEFFHRFLEEQIALNVIFRCAREDWIQRLVRDDQGVSLMPRYTILSADVDQRPVDPPLYRTVQLAVPDHSEIKPALAAFLNEAVVHDWPSDRHGTTDAD